MTLRSVTLSTSAEILLVPVCAALAFDAEKTQPDANAMAGREEFLAFEEILIEIQPRPVFRAAVWILRTKRSLSALMPLLDQMLRARMRFPNSKRASQAEVGHQLAFARILLRRHFRLFQHNRALNGHVVISGVAISDDFDGIEDAKTAIRAAVQ